MKTATLCNKSNPTNDNTPKHEKVRRELINAYQKEQIEYNQGHINKIRNSGADSKSSAKRKSTSSTKNKSCQPRRTNKHVVR